MSQSSPRARRSFCVLALALAAVFAASAAAAGRVEAYPRAVGAGADCWYDRMSVSVATSAAFGARLFEPVHYRVLIRVSNPATRRTTTVVKTGWGRYRVLLGWANSYSSPVTGGSVIVGGTESGEPMMSGFPLPVRRWVMPLVQTWSKTTGYRTSEVGEFRTFAPNRLDRTRSWCWTLGR